MAQTKRNETERTGLFVLGNQLFAARHLHGQRLAKVFMREDMELCTYYRFHQQKIAYFLAAMRCHAGELRDEGHSLTYQTLAPSAQSYDDHLVAWVRAEKIARLVCFEIEDKFVETRLLQRLEAEGIACEVWPSPMFLTSRAQFDGYLGGGKRPFMKTFYEAQRRRLGVLLDAEGRPVGGRWSFDEDNRQPLPAHVEVPRVPEVKQRPELAEVIALCREHFAEHPGDAAQTWLPVDRPGAQAWLKAFLRQRLDQFGPYEDALTERSDVVFHGALTPMLNTGLLTPDDVLQLALHEGRKRGVPLQSLEGFVRQLVGWREFIRGIYRRHSEVQEARNHFGHTRKLSSAWYAANTGVPPLDAVLDKVLRLGWAHHIERLMVLGSTMLLCEVAPSEAHRWFMEMFIDSSDWVMGPNVYGMALHSDGGIFATKPYFCGSNYYRKMGGYPTGAWCDGVDGLYWRFVDRHQEAFGRNPRTRQMVRGLARIAPERRERIERAATELQGRLTEPAS